MFFKTIHDTSGKQQKRRTAFKAVDHSHNYSSVEINECLRTDLTRNQPGRCMGSYKRSCLTQMIPPLWQVSIFRVRSCLECCVRYWMNSTRLSENENFWVNAAKSRAEWMFADRFTDWRFPESILEHSKGEILLGQMSIPLLADVAVFPRGNYAYTKKVSIIQANRNFSKLNRALVLVAGSAAGVNELLEWMIHNVVAYNVTLFTRDDKEIGKRELVSWRRFVNMQNNSTTKSIWFIMNSNLKLSTMTKYNVRTFHLGIKFPVGYLAGLRKVEASVLYNKKGREKLLTCSSMKFSYSDRIRMRQELESNGFNCHEGERYGIGSQLLPKKQKALSRKNQFHYVELLSNSFFFASPEGNGRDCYRHLEGISAGSILLARNFREQDAEKFRGIPVLNFPSWKKVTKEKLLSYRISAYSNPEQFDLKRAFFPWWLSQIIQI